MGDKKIKHNKTCWVQGCDKQQAEDSLLCEEHKNTKDIKLSVPKVTGNPNVPL